ncbi:MAG: F0F1 ATP synthase subunit A [Clostridium sp.]|nr:F0F1 ATP synthase subunit A [Clostridium sp.]
MDLNAQTVFNLHIANHSFGVSTSIVTQWCIMVIIMVLVFALTRNLKKVPDKKQSIVEMIVGMFNGLVEENMGKKYRSFIPFIGTMGVFLFFLNLSGLVGVEPSTEDINVTAAFALISFVVINGNAFIKVGLKGYLKDLVKPFPLMLPMNLLEKITLPISLCLRLFCNMLVGAIIIGLFYQLAIYLKYVLAFVGPIPLHFFFDLFDGIIQVYIFMMLTMLYTRMGAEEE